MGGIVNKIFGGQAPKAPDYAPLANASKESAEIMAKLGYDQMAEGKRQFDINQDALAPVLQAQLGIMNDSRDQGTDYFNYMKDTFRPVEQALVKEANDFNTEAAKEQFSRKAIADLESAQANELAQSNRAMAAMGINPNSGRFASANRASGLRAAADRASVATGSRLQADAMGSQKKMDAIAIGKGMAGFSSAANNTALQAGGQATGTQMAPGQAYMQSLGQGAQTIGQGRNLLQGGLGNILSGQASAYSTQAAMRGQNMDLIGTGAGAVLGAFGASDRRLKENIKAVGVDEETGLTLYEFNYINAPEFRFRGVMADEVEPKFPDAVIWGKDGFAAVDYGKIGIQMVRV